MSLSTENHLTEGLHKGATENIHFTLLFVSFIE